MKNINELQKIVKDRWSEYRFVDWAIMGLNSEAGEVADLFIKRKWRDKKVDLTSELGDVLHYLLAIAYLEDIKLEDIINNNIDKVIKRHPDSYNKEYEK